MRRTTKTLCRFAAINAVLLLVGITGCSDTYNPGSNNLVTTGNGLTAGGSTLLYAVEQTASTSTSSILQFGLTGSSTSLSPAATITPPSGTYFTTVATDSLGQIYAGGYLTSTGQGEILVYAASANGAATPLRTILGGLTTTTTTFAQPKSMHVSSAGTLAVLSQNGAGYSVATMPSTSNGAVTPTTLLEGTATQMTGVKAVTVDQNNTVYVTNYGGSTGSILIFAPAATGNTAPGTVITTGNTGPYGIAADASGNVFTVLDSPTSSSAGSLVVYAAGASGAATPSRTLTGSATGIYFGGGVRLDSVGNLYMMNATPSGSSATYSIVAFAQSASGNVAPGLTFQSPQMSSPASEIAVR